MVYCSLRASLSLCELNIEMLLPRLFVEKQGSTKLMNLRFKLFLNWESA